MENSFELTRHEMPEISYQVPDTVRNKVKITDRNAEEISLNIPYSS